MKWLFPSFSELVVEECTSINTSYALGQNPCLGKGKCRKYNWTATASHVETLCSDDEVLSFDDLVANSSSKARNNRELNYKMMINIEQ